MISDKITQIYENRLASFTELFQRFQKKSNTVSLIRLLTVLFTITAVIYGVKTKTPVITQSALAIGISFFLFLIIYHEKVISRISRLQKSMDINQKGISRLENKWNSFTDTGEEFVDEEHEHSFDLDIFGKASLYQYITTSHTFLGRKKLAENICGENVRGEITERQKGIRELAEKIDFRQNIEVCAIEIEKEDPAPLFHWFETPNKNMNALFVIFIQIIPFISISCYLGFKLFHLPGIMHVSLYCIQVILFLLFYKKSHNFFSILSVHKNSLMHYSSMIQLIEKETFSSTFLKELQSNVTTTGSFSTYESMKRLNGLIQKSDVRFNPFLHFIINAITLWDFRIIHQAEQWKEQYGTAIRDWITIIAEFESLNSLAILAHDNPTWQTPELNSSMEITAQELRHPLIPNEQSVGNDFGLNAEQSITIISGSNMSGKSTFLRTVAINLLLAYTGAPVAAKQFSCGIFEIMTAMRNSDNVSKNISTFYAELLRIKAIVEKVQQGKPVFFVIDEIFSGTNSKDRIDGAFALLKELHCGNSIGMVSTHDLELCTLSEEAEYNFANYHFKEYYESNHIHFDYTISSGPSTTSNALFLMNMVGIPIQKR